MTTSRALAGGVTVLRTSVLVVALLLPLVTSPFHVFQFTQVLMYYLAVLSLCFLTGFSGQVSIGHSMFFAIGAYTAAIGAERWDVPLPAAFVLAFVLAFALGVATAVPALFMSTQYRVVVTLGLAVATPSVIARFADFTGGSQGILVPALETPKWMPLADDQYLYYIALIVAGIGLYLVHNLTTGRVQRGMTAVKDDEIVARSMGVDTARAKLLSFGYSAALAGLAGVLYAYLVGYVTPHAIGLIMAINMLVGACVAGLRFIGGAVFGAAFLVYVPVHSAEVNDALGSVILGFVVVVISLYLPHGVGGLLHSAAARAGVLLRRRVSGTPKSEVNHSTRPDVSTSTPTSTTGSSIR